MQEEEDEEVFGGFSVVSFCRFRFLQELEGLATNFQLHTQILTFLDY